MGAAPGSGHGVGDAARRVASLRGLGLRLADERVAHLAEFVFEGKASHQRVVQIANDFFATLGDYLRDERLLDIDTDRVFVVLKRPRWVGR